MSWGEEMEVFRVQKTDKYTIISNEHIFNPDLTNKAKGLLTTLLALPKSWKFNVNGLAKLSKDSRDGILSQLKELETAGYLTKKRNRNEKGQLTNTEFTVYESKNLNPCYTNCKDKEADNTESCNTKCNIDETNNTKCNYTNSNINESENTYDKTNVAKSGLNTGFSPRTENPTLGKLILENPETEKPELEKPELEKPELEKPTLLNTNISNTNISNTNLSINQIDEIDLSDRYYRSLVAQRISYDEIIDQLEYQDRNPDEPKIVHFSKEFYKTAYELICDVMLNTNQTIPVGGVNLNAERVKEVLLKNDEGTIAYVYECMMKRSKSEPIKNIKAYLLTALYNAPLTINAQIESEIAQHNNY